MKKPRARRWHHPWLGEMWGNVPVGLIWAVVFPLIWLAYFWAVKD